MPGSAAQPNFFSVNFRDLLPAQSQDEPAVYELGSVTSLSYFTNFLALKPQLSQSMSLASHGRRNLHP